MTKLLSLVKGMGIAFVLAVIIGTLCFSPAEAQDYPNGGGAQAQAVKIAPTLDDLRKRTTGGLSGEFKGPWNVTFTPHQSGANPRTIKNVKYVTMLNNGVLIVPVKNRGGTHFLYVSNWSLEPVQKTNPAESG
jgi:hypothetical protein